MRPSGAPSAKTLVPEMCVKKAERASRLFYFTEKEVRKIKKIADSPYNPPPKKKGDIKCTGYNNATQVVGTYTSPILVTIRFAILSFYFTRTSWPSSNPTVTTLPAKTEVFALADVPR